MTMNCKQTQRELALWVGGDHDPLLQEMVTTHLQSCPDCRAFAREIQAGTEVLRQPAIRLANGGTQGEAPDWSLWPRIQARLQRSTRRESQYAPATVGWFPVAGLTVACVALIAVSFANVQSYQGDPGFEFPLGQQNFVPATNQVFGMRDNMVMPGNFQHGPLPQGPAARGHLPSEQELRKILLQLRREEEPRVSEQPGEPAYQLILPDVEQ